MNAEVEHIHPFAGGETSSLTIKVSRVLKVKNFSSPKRREGVGRLR